MRAKDALMFTILPDIFRLYDPEVFPLKNRIIQQKFTKFLMVYSQQINDRLINRLFAHMTIMLNNSQPTSPR